MEYDFFVSYASEDQDTARAIADEIEKREFRVWFDERELVVGDSLRSEIDRGLGSCRFGVVLLSPAFFSKNWPQIELDSLVARQGREGKLILPVWHEVDADTVAAKSPILAGLLGVSTKGGVDKIVDALLLAVAKGIGEASMVRPTTMQLLGQLARQRAGIILLASTVPGLALLFWLGWMAASVNPTEYYRRHSPGQAALRERPAIQAFEAFLDDAAKERFDDAYARLATNGRIKAGLVTAADLAWEYRMTQKHDVHYYIPTSIEDDREAYDVEFTYWDYFPRLPKRKALIDSPLGESLPEAKLDQLADELAEQLAYCYEVSPDSLDWAHRVAKEFFVRHATMRDLVLRDDLVDHLGKEHRLEPIIANETLQGKEPAAPRRRMFNVVMQRSDDGWRLDYYNSYMMDKR